MRRRSSAAHQRAPARGTPPRRQGWFAEFVPGLEEVSLAELRRLGALEVRAEAGGAVFGAKGEEHLRRVLRARTVAAFYLRLGFDVPRPKALLGDAAFRRLSEAVVSVAGEGGKGSALSAGSFDGLRLAAAGAGSPVMQRLGEELARAAGLGYDPEEGELLVRLRREARAGGWEALIRLTPRPATARGWRVCNRAGGLNAAVAAAMNELSGMRRSDRYLNLMCGSGTLLVERALAGPARRLVGVDIDPAATACAQRNLAAAGVLERCELLTADVRALGEELTSGHGPFDVLTADVPWGDAVGRHEENATLHGALLAKAAQLAAPHARLALLTHEVRLFRSLEASLEGWEKVRELQVAHGGHHPLLVVLERR